jgi:hypothetical protein
MELHRLAKFFIMKFSCADLVQACLGTLQFIDDMQSDNISKILWTFDETLVDK